MSSGRSSGQRPSQVTCLGARGQGKGRARGSGWCRRTGVAEEPPFLPLPWLAAPAAGSVLGQGLAVPWDPGGRERGGGGPRARSEDAPNLGASCPALAAGFAADGSPSPPHPPTPTRAGVNSTIFDTNLMPPPSPPPQSRASARLGISLASSTQVCRRKGLWLYSTRCTNVPVVNFEFSFSSHLGTQQVFELFRFLALEWRAFKFISVSSKTLFSFFGLLLFGATGVTHMICFSFPNV